MLPNLISPLPEGIGNIHICQVKSNHVPCWYTTMNKSVKMVMIALFQAWLISSLCSSTETPAPHAPWGFIIGYKEEDGTGRLHGSVARRNKMRCIACAQHLFLHPHMLYTLSATPV